MITDEELMSMYQLKSIVRYNNKPKLKEESVAEHSFFVALICMKVCDNLNVDEKTKSKAVYKALLHDMPEIEINDITHDVKERLQLDDFLAKYEDEYYQKNFSAYTELMRRHSDLVDAIVDYADAASVKQFCLHEMSLGNKSATILRIYHDACDRIKVYEKQIKESI